MCREGLSMLSSARVALLACALLAAGCSLNRVRTEVIQTPEQMNAALAEAKRLSAPQLEKLQLGQALDGQDREGLRQALQKFELIVEYLPGKAGSHFGTARIAEALGNFADAEQHYSQALLLIPANPAGDDLVLRAESLRGLADCLVAGGKYQEAADKATAAIKLFPNNAEYFASRASALIQLGKLAEAKRDLQAALKLDPESPRAAALQRLVKASR